MPPKAVPSSAQKGRIQASFWKDSREETEGECGGLGEPDGGKRARTGSHAETGGKGGRHRE